VLALVQHAARVHVNGLVAIVLSTKGYVTNLASKVAELEGGVGGVGKSVMKLNRGERPCEAASCLLGPKCKDIGRPGVFPK
jgi:hypothetical protein